MFVHYRTRGFILNKVDIGEYDRIFTIFTEDFGRLELLAKAERKIKSKLRASLEIFYLSEIEFIQGKTYKTLTDAVLINNFKNLRKGLKRLAIAHKISETLNAFVNNQEPDEKIWRLLSDSFEKLNNWRIKNSLKIIFYYFLWNFLSALGYQPELHNCGLCQKKLTSENVYLAKDNLIFAEKQKKQASEMVYFSAKNGGLVCDRCAKSIKSPEQVDADAIKIIRIVLKKDWAILKKIKFKEENLISLKMISDYYTLETLEQLK